MTRTATAWAVAALLGSAASMTAQVPVVPPPTASAQPPLSNDKASDIHVTGCVARNTDGTYLLTHARIDPADKKTAERAAAATVEASGATAVGTSGATEPAGSGTTNSGSTWALSGGSDLDKHVGHRVQISGREVKPAAPPAESAVTPAVQQRLDVQSVKMIATSCS